VRPAGRWFCSKPSSTQRGTPEHSAWDFPTPSSSIGISRSDSA
jgi:hypothetical protein